MISRTKAAFLFSCDRLFKQHEKVYFWTVTFKSVPLDDNYAMEDWDAFRKRIHWHFPSIKGLRVCELHRSHGIHFHFLINLRIPVRRMKRIARGSGRLVGRDRYLDFGRMWAVKCDKGTAEYLAKYLTKSYREDNQFGRRRRWGTIGNFKQTRCRDIEFDTEALRNRERLFGCAQCGFMEIIMIQHYTNLWGHVQQWPIQYKALVLRQNGRWMKERYLKEPF